MMAQAPLPEGEVSLKREWCEALSLNTASLSDDTTEARGKARLCRQPTHVIKEGEKCFWVASLEAFASFSNMFLGGAAQRNTFGMDRSTAKSDAKFQDGTEGNWQHNGKIKSKSKFLVSNSSPQPLARRSPSCHLLPCPS